MAPKCYICDYYVPKNVSLFRIPDRNDEYSERVRLWLKLLEEKPENLHKIRICSKHFLNKKPAKSSDYLDLDWVVNKDLGRFSKNWKRIESHFRKKIENHPVFTNLHKSQDHLCEQIVLQVQDLRKLTENENLVEKVNSNAVNTNRNVIKSNSNLVTERIFRNNDDLLSKNVSVGSLDSNLNSNGTSYNNFNNDFDVLPIFRNNDNLPGTNLSDGVPGRDTNSNRTSYNSDFESNNSEVATERSHECIFKTNDILSVVSTKRIATDISNMTENVSKKCVATERSHERIFKTNDILSVVSTKRIATGISNMAEDASKKCSTQSLTAKKKKRIHIIEQQFFFPKEMQTDLSLADIDLLFKHYKEAVEERDALLLKISTLVIDVDFFKGNDKKTRFYTGLTTWSLFNNLFEMIKNFLPTHFNCKLSRFQMLALTLMKLRLNLSFTDIGYRFQVDETTASKYFYRCLFILFKLFNDSKLLRWPRERKNLLQNTPSYFRSTFKELITIIVDCFEIFIERSSLLRAAAQAFSHYKHHETLKYLIGISITGVILFVSIGFGGRASDKEVVTKSGFLNNLQEGDVVLGDKGFLIEDEVKAKDASLKIQSFVKNRQQLHPKEIEQSRDYARIRIHVERLICVLREKFNICSDIAQMSTIAKQNDLFDNDVYDKIILVCSCLVNICPSVVNNDFEM